MKPCPFCGEKARRAITAASGYAPGNYNATIYCTNKNCGAEIHTLYSAPAWMKNPIRQARLDIERRWNRRCGGG